MTTFSARVLGYIENPVFRPNPEEVLKFIFRKYTALSVFTPKTALSFVAVYAAARLRST